MNAYCLAEFTRLPWHPTEGFFCARRVLCAFPAFLRNPAGWDVWPSAFLGFDGGGAVERWEHRRVRWGHLVPNFRSFRSSQGSVRTLLKAPAPIMWPPRLRRHAFKVPGARAPQAPGSGASSSRQSQRTARAPCVSHTLSHLCKCSPSAIPQSALSVPCRRPGWRPHQVQGLCRRLGLKPMIKAIGWQRSWQNLISIQLSVSGSQKCSLLQEEWI